MSVSWICGRYLAEAVICDLARCAWYSCIKDYAFRGNRIDKMLEHYEKTESDESEQRQEIRQSADSNVKDVKPEYKRDALLDASVCQAYKTRKLALALSSILSSPPRASCPLGL
jgi:hypothetical protein